METKDYLKDIKDIKQMMSESSRFISLSGLSGILAGVYSLIGAWLVNRTIDFDTISDGSYSDVVISYDISFRLFIIAALVFILSLASCIVLSYKKASKTNEKIWNPSSKRLLLNFSIPLLTGGFLILFLIEKEMLNLVVPLTLIFYGLACVNASKYTLGDVRYFGIILIILGLLSTWFMNYGLLFWALGFGICHIIYGTVMYYKYDRN